MMNSLHNSVKYLRLINIKTALNVARECAPNKIQVVSKPKLDFSKAKTISFAPRSIGVEITDKTPQAQIKQDPIPYVPIVNPRSILPLVEDWKNGEIGLPAIKKEEIQCVRLIVIRRKKMKKHQRRKLWKRMRHRWARASVVPGRIEYRTTFILTKVSYEATKVQVRVLVTRLPSVVKQRRRQVKEKIFQNGLLAMIKDAKDFSAEGYVAQKIEKANHTPLPTRWRHKRLPEFIIRQLLGIDKKINYKHTDVYKA